MDLHQIVRDYAACIKRVDARAPQAVNVRSKKPFQPGIGPHSETQTVKMVASEMRAHLPKQYANTIATGVPYPDAPRHKCDFCIGRKPNWQWAIEVKMLRMLGDNGKPNDNILMHILSPYPQHRSAVTDGEKLAASPIGQRNAVLIYGYEAEDFPLAPAIDAFETIASTKVTLGPRVTVSFAGLIHPVHASGKVYGWEISESAASVWQLAAPS